jgi:hypothetical protein
LHGDFEHASVVREVQQRPTVGRKSNVLSGARGALQSTALVQQPRPRPRRPSGAGGSPGSHVVLDSRHRWILTNHRLGFAISVALTSTLRLSPARLPQRHASVRSKYRFPVQRGFLRSPEVFVDSQLHHATLASTTFTPRWFEFRRHQNQPVPSAGSRFEIRNFSRGISARCNFAIPLMVCQTRRQVPGYPGGWSRGVSLRPC